ncbi:MAG: DUF2996 domain-containing protein [Cyanobacteria bacterium J06659_2]
MAEDQKPQEQTSAGEAQSKLESSGPKAKAAPAAGAAKAKKKEKPPAVEDKPFQEFIAEHFIPALDKSLKKNGLDDIALAFEQRKLTVLGGQEGDQCWHVTGHWLSGKRQFNVAFLSEDIKGSKIFYLADGGGNPSTVEQFMGDERKITLDLMVLYVNQRLNGQKWLTRN